MRRVILTVATGKYITGAKRLKRATSEEVIAWVNKLPPQSPPHEDMPYAFKAWAIEYARRQNYDLVLWADASIVPIKPLDGLWQMIEQRGYWIPCNGWMNGEWCSDAALPLLGITREQAFAQPHAMACSFGINLRSKIGATFAGEYLRLAQNGSFRGPWGNRKGEASADHRVLGHRHDQTAISVIADRLGMKLIDPPEWLAYRGREADSTVLIADGSF